MIHILKNNQAKRTLVLLHGTGGDETDLIPSGNAIDSNANMLSIRGNVREHNMNRFFKRISPGVFDEKSLIEETHKLHDFIVDVMNREDLDPGGLAVIGYSNGANIASSIMMFYPDFFKEAILLRPMVPHERHSVIHRKTRVLVSSGNDDPIVPREETMRLIRLLKDMNIRVTHHAYDTGHRLTRNELYDVKSWYDRQHPDLK